MSTLARWLPAGGLFLCSLLSAQVIDAGSATDSGFTGGAVWLIPQALLPPGTTDATLRFGADFTYRIPCSKRVYVVTFQFIEPTVQAIGQRVFSVSVNNQTVLDRLDLVAEAGYLRPVARSVLAMCSEGQLRIRFLAQVRSAVVSSIEVAPLSLCSQQTLEISSGLEFSFGPVEGVFCH